MTPVAPPQVLDPCTLGRPIHLLGGFTAQLKADLAAFFRAELNRRYRASFEVGAVTMAREDAEEAQPRWVACVSNTGRLGVALDRGLLLSVLGYRYGETEAKATTAVASGQVRETATEERLATNLGLRLVRALAARIDAMGQGVDTVHEFEASTDVRADNDTGTWIVTAEVQELSQQLSGRLWFSLDEAWMARLLRHLAPARDKPREGATATLPLAARLKLQLRGRLLQQELPLGQLLDIKVGDVIPVSLGVTDVLVDESKLFTATVAEHKGKLCLSSFESVE